MFQTQLLNLKEHGQVQKANYFLKKTVHMHLYESEVYTGEELNERENEIYHRTIASLYNELKTVQERLNTQVLTEVQLNDDLQNFKETNAKRVYQRTYSTFCK